MTNYLNVVTRTLDMLEKDRREASVKYPAIAKAMEEYESAIHRFVLEETTVDQKSLSSIHSVTTSAISAYRILPVCEKCGAIVGSAFCLASHHA